jgi:hypothetical protein
MILRSKGIAILGLILLICRAIHAAPPGPVSIARLSDWNLIGNANWGDNGQTTNETVNYFEIVDLRKTEDGVHVLADVWEFESVFRSEDRCLNKFIFLMKNPLLQDDVGVARSDVLVVSNGNTSIDIVSNSDRRGDDSVTLLIESKKGVAPEAFELDFSSLSIRGAQYSNRLFVPDGALKQSLSSRMHITTIGLLPGSSSHMSELCFEFAGNKGSVHFAGSQPLYMALGNNKETYLDLQRVNSDNNRAVAGIALPMHKRKFNSVLPVLQDAARQITLFVHRQDHEMVLPLEVAKTEECMDARIIGGIAFDSSSNRVYGIMRCAITEKPYIFELDFSDQNHITLTTVLRGARFLAVAKDRKLLFATGTGIYVHDFDTKTLSSVLTFVRFNKVGSDAGKSDFSGNVIPPQVNR